MKRLAVIFICIGLFNGSVFIQSINAQKYEDLSLKREIIINSLKTGNQGNIFTPVQICLDKKGNIFILDIGDKSIKKFSKKGGFLMKFNEEGKCPGEIKDCYLMRIDNNDNIYLYDESAENLIYMMNTYTPL